MLSTMESIQFTFTPTPEDYASAMIAYYKRQRSTWISLTAFGVVFLYGLYLLATNSPEKPRDLFLTIPLLVVPVLLTVVLFFVVPWNVARKVERNPRMTAPTTWALGADGILIKNRFAESKLDAATFKRITESQTHYLLHYGVNNRLYQIIPKRAFTSVAHETAFRKWLKQHVVRHPG